MQHKSLSNTMYIVILFYVGIVVFGDDGLYIERKSTTSQTNFKWMYKSNDYFSRGDLSCGDMNAICDGSSDCEYCKCKNSKNFIDDNSGCLTFDEMISILNLEGTSIAIPKNVNDIPLLKIRNTAKRVKLAEYNNIDKNAVENPNVNCFYHSIYSLNADSNAENYWKEIEKFPNDQINIENEPIRGEKILLLNLTAAALTPIRGRILKLMIDCEFNREYFEIYIFIKLEGKYKYATKDVSTTSAVSTNPSSTTSKSTTSLPSSPTTSTVTTTTSTQTTTSTRTTNSVPTTSSTEEITTVQITDSKTTDSTPKENSSSNTTTIIVAVVAALIGILLIIIVVLICCLCKRRSTEKRATPNITLSDKAKRDTEFSSYGTKAPDDNNHYVTPSSKPEDIYEELDPRTANTAYAYIPPRPKESKQTVNPYYGSSVSNPNQHYQPVMRDGYQVPDQDNYQALKF